MSLISQNGFVGFTKQELETYRDATVPDLIGPGCRLLFVGINPGLWTAATQTHFCHPTNRFYGSLRLAGLIDFTIDTDSGMTAEQRLAFAGSGMGITNLVSRATVRASELRATELRDGAGRLQRLVSEVGPRVVAMAGVTAYRTAFGAPGARLGPQEDPPLDAITWVIPNPSGLNAHETIGSLADWMSRVAGEAGIG
jgi:TDG/mug DNA glycosylase family protein